MAKTMRLVGIACICSWCAACAQYPSKQPPSEEQIMCTQDAKQCQDGSWVGRSGPHCEFICSAPAAK